MCVRILSSARCAEDRVRHLKIHFVDQLLRTEIFIEIAFSFNSFSCGYVKVVWRVQEQSMRSQVKSSEGEVTMAAGVTQAVITVELNNDDVNILLCYTNTLAILKDLTLVFIG